MSLLHQCGFYFAPVECALDYMISNKFNSVVRVAKDVVCKCGRSLEGEIHFYEKLPLLPSSIQNMFPKFVKAEHCDTGSRFLLEYIDGTTIDKLYAEGLMTDELFKRLVHAMHTIHACDWTDNENMFSEYDIYHHYFDKFEQRSSRRCDYPFEDFEQVRDTIAAHMRDFIRKKHEIAVIHGDFWFSNMLLHKQQFKFIDMRGKFYDKLTVKGHILYDYSKLYQSIIGLDCVIKQGRHIDASTRTHFEELFWTLIGASTETQCTIRRLTAYLIFCTFFCYDDQFAIEKKRMIWELVAQCLK